LLTGMAQRWIATDFGGLDALRLVETAVPEPGPGEVTIRVRAAGMNPADHKHLAGGAAADRSQLPLPIGYEVAGVLAAVGPDTEIASGGGAVGDEVLAFRVRGGYASELTVPARDVFAKPASLGFPEAANLLLAGTTAAEMLAVTGVGRGDTVLLHAASGAVGVSVLQQAGLLGARVIGTASEAGADVVRRFGGEPVPYGPGLLDRVRALAPDGVDAALDAAGTDEAVDVSLALVDRDRIVTVAAAGRAQREGFRAIGGRMPASAAFRDSVRGRLIELSAAGDLVVPVARTFPLPAAVEALRLLQGGHPGGKLALLPDA
jgi:NADPH:quinone reductase-like Zn-dependent oxidoreductase